MTAGEDYLEDTVAQQGVLGWCWPVQVQRGPLDQPQWGCNRGAKGTDERAEVTEECPSAGEWVADSNIKHIAEPRNKKRDGLRDLQHAYCTYVYKR